MEAYLNSPQPLCQTLYLPHPPQEEGFSETKSAPSTDGALLII